MFHLFQTNPTDGPKSVWSGIKEDMTLDQVGAAMVLLMAEENINHYRMGVLYNYAVDRKLAELAGYKNALDFFQQKLADLSQSALSMYGVVARDFSEETSRRFGVTCLSLLRTYKDLASIKVNHDQPGDTPIEVPDKKGVVTTKPFGQCSVDEMRRALQLKRKPTSSQPLAEEHVAVADQVGKAVLERFEKGDPVKVQLRNHQGEAILDFTGIPLSKRMKLAEALMASAQSEVSLPQQGEKVSPTQ
ncbi:hypothetical protein [Hyalangium versicolor]|uniref:hypothetical protein n=1 Tax=Hyalangium versicolor TaxID=2861190 RepID=UPI001CD00D26|nr:hypothetical protein [Hyalangium versicolor]